MDDIPNGTKSSRSTILQIGLSQVFTEIISVDQSKCLLLLSRYNNKYLKKKKVAISRDNDVLFNRRL